MIAKTTEDFVEKEVFPQVEYLENHEFDRTVKLLKQAGELGLLAADVPEEYGGLGLDKVSSALITEKMSNAGGFSFLTVRMLELAPCQLYYLVMKNKRRNIYHA